MVWSTRVLPIVLCGALLAACTRSAATVPPSPTVAPSATTAPPSPTVAPSATTAPPSPTVAPSATTAPPSPTATPGEPTATAPGRYAAALVYGNGVLSALPPEGGMGAGLDNLPQDLDPTLIAVAPDGSALAYVRAGRALIRDLVTGRDEDITPPELDTPGSSPGGSFRAPAISPDGRYALVTEERGGGPIAWAIPLTGPEQPVELSAGWGVGWQ